MRTLIGIVVIILVIRFFGCKTNEEVKVPKIDTIEVALEDTTSVMVCTREGCKNVTMEDRKKAAEEAQRIIDEIMK